MIRLGVRLAVSGGREAIARLALIAVAVAIGVGLLVTTIASINAFDAQNQRYAWLETGFGDEAATRAAIPGVDPVWWQLRADDVHGIELGRIDLAATGPHAPVPPGIPALPGPGQFYASPALTKLLATTPRAELGARYPGTQVGIIGPAALPAPDTLLIVIGHDPDDASWRIDAHQITSISTTSPGACTGACAPFGTDANGMTLVLSVVAAALLFPVLIFIGGATRLSASRREQRFAAMRLVGANPRQVTRIAAVESSVATLIGVAVGFVLFAAARPLLSSIPFSGQRFFTNDLSLGVGDVLAVTIGVPVAAALAARLALRRVSISPLGVTRRVTPRPPRAGRVLPLVAGIGWLTYLAFWSEIPEDGRSDEQAYAYLLGIFLVMIGLVVAGSWLTMVCARILARRARQPAGLIAARRLGDNPKAAFRAISGVVLAVFVGTCSIGVITTIVSYNGSSVGSSAAAVGTLVQRVFVPDGSTAPTLSPAGRRSISAVPGVRGVVAIRTLPDRITTRVVIEGQAAPALQQIPSRVACTELAHAPVLGRCPPGAAVVMIDPDFGGAVIDRSHPMADTTWPAVDMTLAQLAALPLDVLVVATDGTPAAVEGARTATEQAVRTLEPPLTLREYRARNDRQINGYRQLANVVLLTSLPIAGCSLAVAVVGGLADRRRPFSLLRLTGAPLTLLRRIIGLETAFPLVVSVVVSAATGLGAAALFLHAQLDQTLRAPTLGYYLLLLAGTVASCAVVASTLPFLDATTGPETARND